MSDPCIHRIPGYKVDPERVETIRKLMRESEPAGPKRATQSTVSLARTIVVLIIALIPALLFSLFLYSSYLRFHHARSIAAGGTLCRDGWVSSSIGQGT